MLATEVIMTPIEKLVRPARIEDADLLAELVDYAGEGLPSYLWHKIAGPGETAQEVGRKRAARETGSFSYRNATMIEHAGRALALSSATSFRTLPSPSRPTCRRCSCRCRSLRTWRLALGM